MGRGRVGIKGERKGWGDLLVLIEDLHPDESVEYHCSQLFVLFLSFVAEDLVTCEIHDECDDQLEDSLADNHLPHVQSNQWCSLAFRFPVQNIPGWRISCESESSEGVHNQVHPEQLHSCENRFLSRGGDGGNKSEDNGSDVDCELKLETISILPKPIFQSLSNSPARTS